MQKLSRRDLLARTALLAGSGCLCSVLGAAEASTSNCCATPALEPQSYSLTDHHLRIDLEKTRCLEHAGTAAYVLFGPDQGRVIIVRSGRSSYHVLTGLCTHARQVLSYVKSRRLLMCNGFNHSLFNLDGSVFKGPAEGPLKVYATRLNDRVLEVKLS
jgi:nitrite reductase/ring-hydroxylating ferredoxin subunit